MKLLDTTHKSFTPHEAERVAAEMQADDDDWQYVAMHDPKGTGWSYISVRENGEEIARV